MKKKNNYLKNENNIKIKTNEPKEINNKNEDKKTIINKLLKILKELDFRKREKELFIKELENKILYLVTHYKLSKNNLKKLIDLNMKNLKKEENEYEFDKTKQSIIKLIANEKIEISIQKRNKIH